MSCWQCSTWQMLLALLLKLTSAEYQFVNLFQSDWTAINGTTSLDDSSAGTVRTFSDPTALIGFGSINGSDTVMEWSNAILVGREFAHTRRSEQSAHYAIFSTQSAATVTLSVNGNVEDTETFSGLTVRVLSAQGARNTVEINSTADVLVSVASGKQGDGNWGFTPLPPVAQTLYGQCSQDCFLHIWGGDTDPSIPIEQTCTDGSTATVQAGKLRRGSSLFNGATCKWTAPHGYRISGQSYGDSSGKDTAAFLSDRYFQLVTPVPTYMPFVLLISAERGTCFFKLDDDNQPVELEGANGVYDARVEHVTAATIIVCDMPVP